MKANVAYKWVFIIPSPSLLTRTARNAKHEDGSSQKLLFHARYCLLNEFSSSRHSLWASEKFAFLWISLLLSLRHWVLSKIRNEWDNWIGFLKFHWKEILISKPRLVRSAETMLEALLRSQRALTHWDRNIYHLSCLDSNYNANKYREKSVVSLCFHRKKAKEMEKAHKEFNK